MKKQFSQLFVTVLAVFAYFPLSAWACGGFFCQLTPIDQAGEQIVFRQDGGNVTALVQIQYTGESENFAWVVPVPGIPEFQIGSDLLFSPLDVATRPQFVLERTGAGCPVTRVPDGDASTVALSESADDGEEERAVEILQTVTVGPFDIEVVTSDDETALAIWLEENNFDLSDRGRELIAPYVEQGMNFVTLKLSQNQGVGDIQPLMMTYQSSAPMIPIRLTAVAAEPDMGILVWILGDARAVPTNFFHVTPNYTQLNWYTGANNAYASYQDLITAAMDEAGGQGFATDYAGTDFSFVDSLPSVAQLNEALAELQLTSDDALFISLLYNSSVFPQDKSIEMLSRLLPLPDDRDDSFYANTSFLNSNFSDNDLSTARTAIAAELTSSVIEPLDESLALFNGAAYMTRLYTTLSPEEMTVDPVFGFNSEMDGQQLDRHATMNQSCVEGEDRWTLTLGEGTGREGELVIDMAGRPPFSIPVEVSEQDALWRSEVTRATGGAELKEEKEFETVVTQSDGSNDSSGGAGALNVFLIGLLAAFFGVLSRSITRR